MAQYPLMKDRCLKKEHRKYGIIHLWCILSANILLINKLGIPRVQYCWSYIVVTVRNSTLLQSFHKAGLDKSFFMSIFTLLASSGNKFHNWRMHFWENRVCSVLVVSFSMPKSWKHNILFCFVSCASFFWYYKALVLYSKCTRQVISVMVELALFISSLTITNTLWGLSGCS